MLNMRKKFKILAASDLHGDTNQVLKLANRAKEENVDLVVLCGDLTSPIENKGIIKPFLDAGKRVIFVPGNHDGIHKGEFLSELYGIKNMHGNSTEYYDIGFFGCGLANVGPDALTEEEFYDTLKSSFLKIKDKTKKIMITHIHPDGTIVDKIEPGFGSKGVRKAIESFKPDFVLCGHVHSAAGVEDFIDNTKVINVGRNGKIIEL